MKRGLKVIGSPSILIVIVLLAQWKEDWKAWNNRALERLISGFLNEKRIESAVYFQLEWLVEILAQWKEDWKDDVEQFVQRIRMLGLNEKRIERFLLVTDMVRKFMYLNEKRIESLGFIYSEMRLVFPSMKRGLKATCRGSMWTIGRSHSMKRGLKAKTYTHYQYSSSNHSMKRGLKGITISFILQSPCYGDSMKRGLKVSSSSSIFFSALYISMKRGLKEFSEIPPEDQENLASMKRGLKGSYAIF